MTQARQAFEQVLTLGNNLSLSKYYKYLEEVYDLIENEMNLIQEDINEDCEEK